MKKFFQEVISTDVLVIGAGVAGLRVAIEIGLRGYQVLVLAKDQAWESSTAYAQGGVAVALGEDDEIVFHYQDTIAAGDGLCDPGAVKILVNEGPEKIQELIQWGAEFDREGGNLLFTREAAHRRSRVIHAHGDATGKEIARVLLRKAQTIPSIKFRDFAFTVDLWMEEEKCRGAYIIDIKEERGIAIKAQAVILATGGLGQIYLETTNPRVSTGDGVAIAYRAGAELMDMEFVQFHPTTLYLPNGSCFLITEAVRGEGGVLRNSRGEQFMARYHPLADLAPRDIVSRVILEEMQQTGGKEVCLDLTALDSHYLQKRFPTIYKTCLDYKIDISRDLIPVRPSAHYAMGGVRTDYWGRTGRENLYACGEVAGTGLHGANRLASNSLLEGVVFGARAGKAVLETLTSKPFANLGEKTERSRLESTGDSAKIGRPRYPDVLEGTRQQLRRLMWDKVGIIRSRDTLEKALEQMHAWGYLEEEPFFTREELEVRNMFIVARTITQSALEREESRGTHYRKDFSSRDDIHWKKHIIFQKGLSYFLSLENQPYPSEIDKLPR